MSETAAGRLMWVVCACLFGVWALLFLVLRLPGSYMHVFLVAAIGTALMNLIAHTFTHPDTNPAELTSAALAWGSGAPRQGEHKRDARQSRAGARAN